MEISSSYTCILNIRITWCTVPEIWSETGRIFLSFWAIFLPFQPPDNLENQNFEIEKKTSRYIIILHICTINDNHMVYGSWDMECTRQNLLSFSTIFTLSPSYGPRKLKFWKNEQYNWRCYHFTNEYHKWQSHFLSFWTIFCSFTPLNNPKN